MHFLCATKNVLQKQLKIDLKVSGKSCDEIDDVMKFMKFGSET